MGRYRLYTSVEIVTTKKNRGPPYVEYGRQLRIYYKLIIPKWPRKTFETKGPKKRLPTPSQTNITLQTEDRVHSAYHLQSLGLGQNKEVSYQRVQAFKKTK